MLRKVLALGAAVFTVFAAQLSLAADAPIGSVTRLQGDAYWRAGQGNEALFVGAPVFIDQKVSTGEDTRLELTFDDGTALTMGENAEMTLDEFVYDPGAENGSIALAVKGAFRFVSGQVTKQPNQQVAVNTPFATIGIRGTDFWGGPIDDQFGGVFLIEGAVSVTNNAGEQILDAAGEGTNIIDPGDAPGEVTIWPDDKVQRALATVTFQ